MSLSKNLINIRAPGCRTGTLIWLSSRGWSPFLLPSSGEFSSPVCTATRLSLQYNSRIASLIIPLTLICVSSWLYTNLAVCNQAFVSKVRRSQHLSDESLSQGPRTTAGSIFNNMRSGKVLGRVLLWRQYQSTAKLPGSGCTDCAYMGDCHICQVCHLHGLLSWSTARLWESQEPQCSYPSLGAPVPASALLPQPGHLPQTSFGRRSCQDWRTGHTTT